MSGFCQSFVLQRRRVLQTTGKKHPMMPSAMPLTPSNTGKIHRKFIENS
jgi:hypothetical protein